MNQGCASYRRLLSRRNFFKVGGAGLFGLSWADFFRAEATAKATPKKAKQAIFIFLQGGPPQTDTFDMKPDRPEDIRGPFKPIKTVIPGLEVCEHLPRLAQTANRFSVLRSVNARGYPQAGDHHGGNTWKTGNPRGMRGTPKYPMYGSVVAKLCPTPRELPAFVAMGEIDTHAPGLKENYLGPAYDPLSVSVDARRDKTADPLTQMLVPAELDVANFERNVQLLRALEQQLRQQDAASDVITGLDQFQQKAFDLLRSPRLREALALEKEPAKNLERYGVALQHYGKVNYTRRVLAARRLIEAGVPFVYVDLPYWDWHNGGGLETPLANLAALDAAFSSLLEDLADRGLLDTTAIIATDTEGGAGADEVWTRALGASTNRPRGGRRFQAGRRGGSDGPRRCLRQGRRVQGDEPGQDVVPRTRPRHRSRTLHAGQSAAEAHHRGCAADQGGACLTPASCTMLLALPALFWSAVLQYRTPSGSPSSRSTQERT